MSDEPLQPDELHDALFWHRLEDGRVQCDLCPRYCQLQAGQRGLCFVRANHNDVMVLTTYGRSSGFCIDPIEKKPLNHFYPGSAVLSFGTAGCNVTCKFCQNWDISKARQMQRLQAVAAPQQIANAASQTGCRSVAYTYNDPVIFHEYARDVALACREQNIFSVAVTAGYITPEAAEPFFANMDAANVDLKAFSERFYQQLCGSHLQPVLETLQYLVHKTDVWVEITTLLIPGENDSDAELHAMAQWVASELGTYIPWHFSAFHPDWKMQKHAPTPVATLQKARQIATQYGMRYVYTGNVHDEAGGTTYCHQCNTPLIGRDWYKLTRWQLKDGKFCPQCGSHCAGRFFSQPGSWGARRQPIDISHY